MKNILVSGASGIVGYGILKSLRRSDKLLNLVGTTIYKDSVAQGFCDVFEPALLTSDEGYLNWLLNIITRHNINLLIPGIEIDLYKWVKHIPEIQNAGAEVLMNNIELIALCKDKWIFYKNLKENESKYAIRSSIDIEFRKLADEFGLPFLLKPRQGFGSKGIVIIEDENSFDNHFTKIGNTLFAQEIVGNEDEEYTTSAFCDGKGSYFCCMTLKRKLSKDGFTEKAEVVRFDEIEEAISLLSAVYKPLGPTNFQFRKHNNELKLLEINPRISSSTSIRSAFGYNEAVMAVEYYLEGKEPKQPNIRPGRAVRYVEDYIFYS